MFAHLSRPKGCPHSNCLANDTVDASTQPAKTELIFTLPAYVDDVKIVGSKTCVLYKGERHRVLLRIATFMHP